jgi:hypothetical protein
VPVRIVGHQGDAGHALGRHLRRDLRHAHFAFRRLAAGHGHGAVDQDLESHGRLGGDGGAHGEAAGVGVGAVAHVGEDVPVLDEVHHAEPGRALAAHLGEGFGFPVHEAGEVVAADAGEGLAAFRHLGGTIVGTAGAEVRRAVVQRCGGAGGERVQLGQTGAHPLCAEALG